MSKDNNYTNVLLEEMRDQNNKILEMVSLIGDELKKKSNQEDMIEVKSDIKVIKAAVMDQGRVLSDHEQRITTLEAA